MLTHNNDSPIRTQNLFATSNKRSSFNLNDDKIQAEIKKQAEILAETLNSERNGKNELSLKA